MMLALPFIYGFSDIFAEKTNKTQGAVIVEFHAIPIPKGQSPKDVPLPRIVWESKPQSETVAGLTEARLTRKGYVEAGCKIDRKRRLNDCRLSPASPAMKLLYGAILKRFRVDRHDAMFRQGQLEGAIILMNVTVPGAPEGGEHSCQARGCTLVPEPPPPPPPAPSS